MAGSIFSRRGKSHDLPWRTFFIYRGGHSIRPATVNSAQLRAQVKAHICFPTGLVYKADLGHLHSDSHSAPSTHPPHSPDSLHSPDGGAPLPSPSTLQTAAGLHLSLHRWRLPRSPPS